MQLDALRRRNSSNHPADRFDDVSRPVGCEPVGSCGDLVAISCRPGRPTDSMMNRGRLDVNRLIMWWFGGR